MSELDAQSFFVGDSGMPKSYTQQLNLRPTGPFFNAQPPSNLMRFTGSTRFDDVKENYSSHNK